MRAEVRRAMQLHRAGDLHSAENLYRDALRIDITDAVATHYLGLLQLDRGEHEKALALLSRSVELGPSQAEFHLNLGSALLNLERTAEAAESFRNCIAINPDVPNAHIGLSRALYKLRQPEEALLALQHCATHPSAQTLRIALKMELGQFASAATELEEIVRRAPESVDTWRRLALAYRRSERFESALGAYQSALAVEPANIDVLVERGETLCSMGKYSDAVENARHGLSIDPSSSALHFNLGFALQKLRRFRESADQFSLAAKFSKGHSQAEKYLVAALLHAGDFGAAWDLAEQRHRWTGALPVEYLRESAMTGSWPAIKSINPSDRVLIIGEQGLGDEVMFGSLLEEFGNRNSQLTVQLDQRLVSIFSRSLPQFKFLSHDSAVEAHDIRLRLGSLPVVLRRKLEDFTPRPAGFLVADEKLIEKFSGQLKKRSRLLCGISWKTINPFETYMRSISVENFCQSLKMDGVDFVNLQYDSSSAECATLREQLGDALLHADVDLFNDIESVAAMIANCDIVITTGNSIAHLAGALGRPTCALIPFSPSWRWFGETGHSLWYASIELLRQKEPGNWSHPLEIAHERLSALLSRR